MSCDNQILVNDWHVIAESGLLRPGDAQTTFLLEEIVHVSRHADGSARAGHGSATGPELPIREQYGFVWTTLGTPAREIIHIPEAFETDRYLVSGGAFGVKVSGLRVVENFLDMGHFPFVHTGWLGDEPHTEVQPYEVELTEEDEIVASECYFYQPVASPTAKGGIMVKYTFRVYRPYTVALYKTNPTHPDRNDYIVLFVQPVGPEDCIVRPYLCYIEDGMGEDTLRWFMQLIFAQDKPILENQIPRRLPLDPRAETPIRADRSAIVYRRWLQDHGVTFGALPAVA